jgi:multidrug efflux pump subunit AcrB
MAAIQRTLPPGVRLKPVYDQAALVRDSVHSVRDAMLVGALLAVVVLLLFLGHGRITAISAASIPLTMAITLFLMKLVGQTLNLMTLGAMAIAIGLVIDDAVVIVENIARHLALGADRHRAVSEAMRELIWPVTTSTLTTVVVFLPLGLLTGVVGQFFAALSATLTIAVLVSLVLALTLVPLLSERYVTAREVEEAPDEGARGVRAAAARIGAEHGVELSVNVGLHWGGMLYMGQIVTRGRLEVTALGDEVNECARIEQVARDGALLASKDLLERLDAEDAAAVGVQVTEVTYTSLAELAGDQEKVVRDAGQLAVTTLD